MRKIFSRRACSFIWLVVVAASVLLILHQVTSKDSIHAVHVHQYLPTSTCTYPAIYFKPSYVAIESYTSVRLVFFKKHKMSIAVTVARNKGWTVTGVTKSFDKLITDMKEDIFTIIFTSSKELSDVLFDQYTNNVNVLVTGIPGAYKFTGAKREQYLTYQRYLNSFGCSIEDIKMMPILYLMDDDGQCQQFFKLLGQGVSGNGDKTWVLKNSRGFGGDQVEVIRNTSILKTRFGNCNSNGQFIVQEYIQNLLLVDKRKFDVRALVVIAGTQPYLLFYHDGYLRVVMKEFDPSASREVHLTNTHVQSLQPEFDPDKHFWSFQKFQNYLDENHPDNNNFVQTKLIPYIKRISLLILKSGINMMHRSSSSFQLLGLDIMITTDWHIWFIESNNYPLWPQGGWITDFTSQMGEDLFDLTIEIRQNPNKFIKMSEGEWYHSWQLVWKENPLNCEDEFNPCKQSYSK